MTDKEIVHRVARALADGWWAHFPKWWACILLPITGTMAANLLLVEDRPIVSVLASGMFGIALYRLIRQDKL